MHLPVFAAVAGGLFAKHDLDVELVEAPPPHGRGLRDFSSRIDALVTGVADLAITTVSYLVAARARKGGPLPVRFIAMLHQSHPLVAIVRKDSCLRRPEDLPDRLTASHGVPWFVDEYRAALHDRGLGDPLLVEGDGPYGAASLGRGHVDVVPCWMDALPVVEAAADRPLDTIRLGSATYATGVVATDGIAAELAFRIRDALVEGMILQQQQPEPGISLYARRFPHVPVDRIVRSWTLFEPFAFGPDGPGAMREQRWRETASSTSRTHGLPAVAAEELYRTSMARDGVTDPPAEDAVDNLPL